MQDFAATPGLSVDMLLAHGAECQDGAALLARLSGRCFHARFRPPFDFVICFQEDGTMWGENNHGTFDRGTWAVDQSGATLTVCWQGGWESSTTRAFALNGALHLMDASTGAWRSSLLAAITPAQAAAFQNAPLHHKHIPPGEAPL